MDIEDQKIGSENKNQMNNYTKRVCHFCHKEFSSGKALGGHMRIHVQKEDDKKKLKIHHTITFKKQKQKAAHEEKLIIADYYLSDDDNNLLFDKKPNCAICGKDFPSKKSLYGHMRSHPGRGWKGINPPSFSSSAASSLSDVDPLPRFDEAVDLTASLKWGWPVTAERGRKATAPAASSEVSSSPVDVELLDAVHYLLMLSRGASLESSKIRVENEHKTSDEVGKAVTDLVHGESVNKTEPSDTGLEITTNKNKKKRKKKKVKLSDLGSSKNVSPLTRVDKYKCDLCDKSFSSHQAFGGHRSSHNKLKIIIINSNDNHSDPSAQSKAAPSSHVALPGEASPVCRRGLEFDLNEVPPSGFEPQLNFTC